MATNGRAVIQGYFPGGLSHLHPWCSVPPSPPVTQPAASAAAGPGQSPPRRSMPGSAPVKERGAVQRKATWPSVAPHPGNVTIASLPANLVNFRNASGSGQPLSPPVQQKMEAAFGTSFADVRVHVTPYATLIGALAFTQGNDLYFAPGQYTPHTLQGQKLLAHELTHVVQQRAGRVRSPHSGTVIVQNVSLEAEAGRMAQRMAFTQVSSARSKPTGAAHISSPQRVRAIQPLRRVPNIPAFLPSSGVLQLARRCPVCSTATPEKQCRRCMVPTKKIPKEVEEVKAAPAAAPAAEAPDILLTSTIYLWEDGKWIPKGGPDTASVKKKHVEVKLYENFVSAKKPKTGSWIGFKQNAWPCKSMGCTDFFWQRSNKHSFVFNVTGDHGEYATEHKRAKGTGGVVYFHQRGDPSYAAPAGAPDPSYPT